MPCGIYIRRRVEDRFTKSYPTPLSKKSTDWLAYLELHEGVIIQHNRNNIEYQVGTRRIPVDGFHRESNTVFQFHGCFYHACPRYEIVKIGTLIVNTLFILIFS